MCQRLTVSKVSNQIASWELESEMRTKAVLLHPFICIADDKETIRLWDYENAAVVNTFDNPNTPDKGVSKLCLLNELNGDGSVRVWRDYTQTDNHRLATSWQSVPGHKPGSRSISAVVDWHQLSGYLYASGQISWIMVWDLDREQLISSISSHSDSCVSAVVGISLYSEACVCNEASYAEGSGSRLPARNRFLKIISASPAEDLKFLDMRRSSAPYLEVETLKGHLTALTVHRHAPV